MTDRSGDTSLRCRATLNTDATTLHAVLANPYFVPGLAATDSARYTSDPSSGMEAVQFEYVTEAAELIAKDIFPRRMQVTYAGTGTIETRLPPPQDQGRNDSNISVLWTFPQAHTRPSTLRMPVLGKFVFVIRPAVAGSVELVADVRLHPFAKDSFYHPRDDVIAFLRQWGRTLVERATAVALHHDRADSHFSAADLRQLSAPGYSLWHRRQIKYRRRFSEHVELLSRSGVTRLTSQARALILELDLVDETSVRDALALTLHPSPPRRTVLTEEAEKLGVSVTAAKQLLVEINELGMESSHLPEMARRLMSLRDEVSQRLASAEQVLANLRAALSLAHGPDKGAKGPRLVTLRPKSGSYATYGRMVAVVIGISNYRYLKRPSEGGDRGRLTDLEFADNDAVAFSRFLRNRKHSGGRWIIHQFINASASTVRVRSRLDAVLSKSRPDDLVYIFFSGHARPSPFDESEIYLLTYDSRYEDLYAGIPYEWLRRKIEDAKAEHVIALMDACKSGVIGFGKGARNANQDFMGKLKSVRPNKILLTSGRGGQRAFEDKELRRSVFTHYLLQGLLGKAPEQRPDGFVDLGELYDYVEANVENHTRRHPNMDIQTPAIWEGRGFVAEGFPVAVRAQ